MENEIVNRVSKSPLVTINLEDFIPEGERAVIDLKEVLFQEMILREGDFRAWVKEKDWEVYSEKFVAISCSAEAIIPQWAYMIIGSKLSGIAKEVVQGDLDQLEKFIYLKNLEENLRPEEFEGKPVVVKGCFDKPIPEDSYLRITTLLKPYVRSIMYGEPCSTVPVYKAPKKS
jgi:hypothetical protein